MPGVHDSDAYACTAGAVTRHLAVLAILVPVLFPQHTMVDRGASQPYQSWFWQ